MSFQRYKIPLLLISIMGFSKAMCGLLSKGPINELLGGAALPVLTFFETLLALWFVLLPMALLLMFYGQSFNIEIMLPVLFVMMIIFKALEVWYRNMPSV